MWTNLPYLIEQQAEARRSARDGYLFFLLLLVGGGGGLWWYISNERAANYGQGLIENATEIVEVRAEISAYEQEIADLERQLRPLVKMILR
jgi:hypothetical protein